MAMFGGRVEDEDLLWFYQKYYYMTEEDALNAVKEYEEDSLIFKAYIESTKIHGRDCV